MSAPGGARSGASKQLERSLPHTGRVGDEGRAYDLLNDFCHFVKKGLMLEVFCEAEAQGH